jgi:hypothetical protein
MSTNGGRSARDRVLGAALERGATNQADAARCAPGWSAVRMA